jgi:hypothetical protein
VDRLQPYQPDPLPHFGGLGGAEVVREAATLLMLLAVGWLAGKDLRTRLAYGVFAFGVWDIAYYVFLIPLTGWPRSLWDWDILFLIPLPWWGPVIAPVAISLLLIAGGALTIVLEERGRPACLGRWLSAASLLGMAVVLGTFMADAIRAAFSGAEAVRQVLPSEFGWGVFWIGYLLMALPVLDLARRVPPVLRKEGMH